jgi:hypothetical protein
MALNSLTASLSDGTGHVVTLPATFPTLSVSGTIVVEVITPPTDLLQGSTLNTWSSSSQSGARINIDASGNYTLSGLAPADDYTVTLRHEDFRTLAREDELAIQNGLETLISMYPVLPAQLRIRVIGPTDQPLPFSSVAFNDALSGEFLGRKYTNEDGWTSWLPRRLSKEQIKATVRVDLPYRTGANETFTLELGDNEGVMQVEQFQQGLLVGQIRNQSGEPIPGVIVTAVQSVDGRTAVNRTTADSSGNYSLTLFEGEARVEAASPVSTYVLASPQTTSIAAGGTTSLDLIMDVLGPGTVSVEMNVKYLGEDWQTVEMDWLEAWWRFKLEVIGAEVAGVGYPVPIYGRPGQTVELNVDGQDMNLPRASQQVQLDDLRNATATFFLEEHGARIRGRVLYDNGQSMSGWHISVYIADETGEWTSVPSATGGGSTEHLDVGVPSAGRYQLRIEPSWPSIYYNIGQYPPVEVIEIEAADGEIIDVGDIVTKVGPQVGDEIRITGQGTDMVWRNPGPLSSSLIASPRAIPGGLVSYRATYVNNSGDTATDVRMLLEIPRETTLATGSVTLNFQPASSNVSGSTLEVPLGTVESGVSGVVSYKVRLADQVDQEVLASTARIAYQIPPFDEELEEQIGQVKTAVYGITLETPSPIITLDTELSGRARGGETVRHCVTRWLLESGDKPALYGEPAVAPFDGRSRHRSRYRPV